MIACQSFCDSIVRRHRWERQHPYAILTLILNRPTKMVPHKSILIGVQIIKYWRHAPVLLQSAAVNENEVRLLDPRHPPAGQRLVIWISRLGFEIHHARNMKNGHYGSQTEPPPVLVDQRRQSTAYHY